MSSSTNDGPSELDDVIEPHDDALPRKSRYGHSKMRDHADDDALALATEQERVDAGLADYAPDEVPGATDPLPPGSSERADRAQRGLAGEPPEHED